MIDDFSQKQASSSSSSFSKTSSQKQDTISNLNFGTKSEQKEKEIIDEDEHEHEEIQEKQRRNLLHEKTLSSSVKLEASSSKTPKELDREAIAQARLVALQKKMRNNLSSKEEEVKNDNLLSVSKSLNNSTTTKVQESEKNPLEKVSILSSQTEGEPNFSFSMPDFEIDQTLCLPPLYDEKTGFPLPLPQVPPIYNSFAKFTESNQFEIRNKAQEQEKMIADVVTLKGQCSELVEELKTMKEDMKIMMEHVQEILDKLNPKPERNNA